VRRVHDILDAAIEVLVEDGAESFSSNRVAERAGISVGSVYKYFANKDLIIAGIVERGLLGSDLVIREGMRRAVDEDLHAVAVEVLTGLCDLLVPFRVLFRELFRSAPLLQRPSVQSLTVERIEQATRDVLLHPRGPYRVVRGEAALFVAINGCAFAFFRWMVDAPEDVPRRAFAEATADVICATIQRADTLSGSVFSPTPGRGATGS
jgi:AcrR family transcriptional regulator